MKKDGTLIKRKKMNDTKTDCKAVLRVKLQSSGYYRVERHVTEHNHNLTRPEWQYLHRVERHISAEKGEVIKTLDAARVRPADAYRYCDVY